MTRTILFRFVLTVFLLGTLGLAHGENVQKYYRYTNDEGVQVMDSRVPPRYAKNGYEVVTISGRVLEVVPPAPSPEEVAELEKQRQRQQRLEEWDEYLTSRYSTVEEIKDAKERKLADFDASMSILRGTVGGLESQIEQQQARAAELERAGREVPQSIIDKLADLKAELEDTQHKIQLRAEDRKKMAKKFDEDIARFKEIEAGE